MSWLQSQSRELLEFALQHSPSCYLSSALEGKIYWCNDSFSDWMGYTPSELERRTWMDISVRDDNLAADIEAARQLEAGLISSYRVLKQYIPKQSRPRYGWLTVQRYPFYGPLEVCLCTWRPIEDESSPALANAMESIKKMSTSLDDLKNIVTQIEQQGAATSIIEKGVVIWLLTEAEGDDGQRASTCVTTPDEY